MTINDVPRELQVEIYLALQKEHEEYMDAHHAEHLEDEADYDESMQPDDDSCTECGGDMRGHQWPYCECMPDFQLEQPEDSIKEEFYPDLSR